MNDREVSGRYEVRSSTGLEGVFVGKDDAMGYADELRANGARRVTVSPVASPEEHPKKSHAQIKREVDEILAGSHGTAGVPTPETLRPEQIEAAFAAGKIDRDTRHVALMDPSKFSERGDVEAMMFAKRTVCQAIAPGHKRRR